MEQPPQPTQPQPATKQKNTFAIVALVLAFIIPPLGFIISIIALVKSLKTKNQTSKILSIIGLVIGFFGSIFFIISIGAAVMVVIQGLSEEQMYEIEAQQQLIKCGSEVEVSVLKIGTDPRICLDNPSDATKQGRFVVSLENTGYRDITDWRITIIGYEKVEDADSGFTSLATSELMNFKHSWTGTGYVQRITLKPKIAGGASNPEVTCSEPNLDWDTTDFSGFDKCSEVTWDDV